MISPPNSNIKTIRITKLAIALSIFCVCSPISVPMAFSPVNISLQTFLISIISIVLEKDSYYIILGYIFLGAIGFPVFAGFRGGLGVLLGPTGGFLFGFLLFPIPIIILLRKNYSKVLVFIAISLSHILLYLIGLPWLKLYMNISISKLLKIGLLPFIPGDILKVFLCTFSINYILKLKKMANK